MLFQFTSGSTLLFLLNYFICGSSCCPACSACLHHVSTEWERRPFPWHPSQNITAAGFCESSGTLRKFGSNRGTLCYIITEQRAINVLAVNFLKSTLADLTCHLFQSSNKDRSSGWFKEERNLLKFIGKLSQKLCKKTEKPGWKSLFPIMTGKIIVQKWSSEEVSATSSRH